MERYIRMMVVLSVITLISGLALGGLNEMTHELAADNVLKFKKIPAVADIYQATSGHLTSESRSRIEHQLLTDKKYIDFGEGETLLLFVLKRNNLPFAVAFERFGQGFGGDLGVMVGYQIDTGKMIGIGITTMSETPGVGTRVTESAFTDQFRRMDNNTVLKVKKDGGGIDAIAGATISSRAVAFATKSSQEFYNLHQKKIKDALKINK